MDETEAAEPEGAIATPIFNVYRRGYDPDQVDRYVADQQHRLDEALHRASESERKLAAAVGQLRELHRRVAVYESEARSAQPPQLDTLGERVQRILQEAWEGAYNLRQEAEREVNDLRDSVSREVEALREQAQKDVEELRDVASREAAEVVDEATRRALHIRDETERRRQLYLERVERDREQAIAQITYLYDQRQAAVAELARLQSTVQATIEEMVHSPLGRPAPGVAQAAATAAEAEAADGRSATEPNTGAAPAAPARSSGLFDAEALTGVAGLPGVAGAAGAPVPGGTSDAEAAVEALLAGAGEPLASDATMAVELEDPRAGQLDVPTGPMERLARPGEQFTAHAKGRTAPPPETPPASEASEASESASEPGRKPEQQSQRQSEPVMRESIGHSTESGAEPSETAAPTEGRQRLGRRSRAEADSMEATMRSSTGRSRRSSAPPESAEAPSVTAAPSSSKQSRRQGVYDAEAEGWT